MTALDWLLEKPHPGQVSLPLRSDRNASAAVGRLFAVGVFLAPEACTRR